MTPYSAIGIDFGTSTTVVRVGNYDAEGRLSQVIPVKDTSTGDGEMFFPTLVFERDDGTVSFASKVKALVRSRKPGRLFQNFKMDLLKDGEERALAEKNIRRFLAFIHEQIEEQASEVGLLPERKVFISVPVKWAPDVVHFMKQAYVDAGFAGSLDDIVVKNEAQAASVWTIRTKFDDLAQKGLIRSDAPSKVMMVDMGAGTTDITIFDLAFSEGGSVEIGDGAISFPPADSEWQCGGREIDHALYEHVQKYREGRRQLPDGEIDQIVLQKVKQEKEHALSGTLADNEVYDWLNSFDSMDPDHAEMGRAQFEEVARQQWTDFHRLVSEALETAKTGHGVDPADIDFVILTGGHSEWYCVNDILLDRPLSSGLPLSPLGLEKIKALPERILGEIGRNCTVANGLVAMNSVSFSFPAVATACYSVRVAIDGAWGKWKTLDLRDASLPYKQQIKTRRVAEGSGMKMDAFSLKVQMAPGTAEKPGSATTVATIDITPPGGLKRLLLSAGAGAFLLGPLGALGAAAYQAFRTKKFALEVQMDVTVGEGMKITGEGTVSIYNTDASGLNKGDPVVAPFSFSY